MLLFLFRRLENCAQRRCVLKLNRTALKRPDPGIDVLRLLVAQRSLAEIRHRGRWNNRRHVRPAAKERNEALLGRKVSPVPHKRPRSGLAVEAMARVAAEGIVERL